MLKINFLTYLTNFQYFCWRCSWLIEYLILNIEKKILFYKCPMIQLISNSIFPRYPFLKKCCKDNEWLVWRTYSQCGNYGNLLSHFLYKNFVKWMFSLKKLRKSWFHEICFQWEWIFSHSVLVACTQCENFMIFLSLRFYVKSSLGSLEQKNYHFNTFRCSEF